MPDPRSKGLRHYVGRNQSPTYQPLRCWRCWKQDNSVSHCKLLSTPEVVDTILVQGLEVEVLAQAFTPVNLCYKCSLDAMSVGQSVEKIYNEEWERLVASETAI